MLRSLLTVSGFTLMSRILGVLRDMLIARYIGASVVSDAFFAAFRFPNMFRRIFGEGAFNSAFIPLFGKRLVQDGQNRAIQFANNAFSTLFLVLGVLTIALIPLMGWVMLAVVPGFKAAYEYDPATPAIHESTDLSESTNPDIVTQPFRIALKGTRTLWLQSDRPDSTITLTNLQLVERGTPAISLVVKEVFGGPAIAVGSGTAFHDAFPQDHPIPATTSSGDTEIFELPLPAGHSFAVIEGEWSGPVDTHLEIFTNEPHAYALATKLSRITFIYLLCMALVAHLSGVLNTLNKFAAAAFSPVLLNIVFLIGLFFFVRNSTNQGEILAWCVAIAGVVQLTVLWWTCRRAGLPIALVRPRLTPGMKRLFLLMGPGILSAGIQQVNLLIGSIIASFQQGAISYIYYSDRIYQLPLGMIGIAFGVVLLPEITRLVKQNDEAAASATMIRGLEMSMLVTLPAAVGLLLIPGPVIAVLFQHGDFTAYDTQQTALALMAFSLGLPGYVLIKILQPGYFAREDTKTPMIIAAITVGVNIVFSITLFTTMGFVGIALATSIAAWVNVILLWLGLRNILHMPAATWLRLGKITLACLAMAAPLYPAHRMLSQWFGHKILVDIGILTGLILLATVTYAGAILILKATSLNELKANFKRG